eukprot:9485644-Pyramimonas_sp.AAC.2
MRGPVCGRSIEDAPAWSMSTGGWEQQPSLMYSLHKSMTSFGPLPLAGATSLITAMGMSFRLMKHIQCTDIMPTSPLCGSTPSSGPSHCFQSRTASSIPDRTGMSFIAR